MSDLTEIEHELRKLRPAQPSPILFERIDKAITDCRAGASQARQPQRLPHHWLSFGLGLAAAAALVLFAAISMEQQQHGGKEIAQISHGSETAPLSNRSEESPSADGFVPAGATRLVYNTRDEGLQFGRRSGHPVRRVHYQTHETWQWRNPTTGASLRVSYPSEEVVLIPVSGQ